MSGDSLSAKFSKNNMLKFICVIINTKKFIFLFGERYVELTFAKNTTYYIILLTIVILNRTI